jgi:hypothetical protein
VFRPAQLGDDDVFRCWQRCRGAIYVLYNPPRESTLIMSIIAQKKQLNHECCFIVPQAISHGAGDGSKAHLGIQMKARTELTHERSNGAIAKLNHEISVLRRSRVAVSVGRKGADSHVRNLQLFEGCDDACHGFDGGHGRASIRRPSAIRRRSSSIT